MSLVQTVNEGIKDAMKARDEVQLRALRNIKSAFLLLATAEGGAEERSIMAMTGHKSSEMVRRYIREANIFKNNALNKLKI